MKPTSLKWAGVLLCFVSSCSTHPGLQSSAAGGGPVACKTPPPYPIHNLIQYANPILGTGTSRHAATPRDGENCCYPGATAPFGMIQWSPDTELAGHPGGYYYADKRISDFSVAHISGAGGWHGGDFAFMPIAGELPTSSPAARDSFALPFSHTNETAKPGYYGVTFDNGLKVELTTTTRTGFGRFTYPAGKPATLMINAGSNINGPSASGIHINPATREISGWAVGGHFCKKRETRKIFFYAVFDQPFKAWNAWSDHLLTPGATSEEGIVAGAYVTFKTGKSQTVLVKLGLSYVSVANAKANVEAENPVSAFTTKDFDAAVKSASDVWNGWLNKIQISGGTKDEMELFYSIMYHAFLGPVVVSDVNGEYLGYDGQVHTTENGREQYGLFSGWDIYRTECQLLGMLAPKEASDMAQSLLMDYQQGGAFPRWGVITEDSGVMMGDPAAPMIADFYAFGATNFDTKATLAGLVRAATDPSVRAERSGTYERDALADYLKLGYVPEGQKGGYGCVSMTLEYASADFALSQFAKALGDKSNSVMLLQHAQNWKNLFNPESGYLEMRRRDGTWAPGFVNNSRIYDRHQAYVEGTAGQYLWMVPFNLKALADLLGGREAAVKRLDEFHTQLNVGWQGPDAWMAWIGNEVNLNTPWIYDFWDRPDKTQNLVRRVMTELYELEPGMYPGNDDLGTMSAWYLFGALGMYPELPGSDILVLGSPLFPKAVLHLPDGDVTIIGKGAAKDAPYVHSLTVNGQSSSKPWIRYADISRGGTLIYDLSSTPDPAWGSRPEDAPPSYDGTQPPPASAQ